MLGAEQDVPYSLADKTFIHPLAHVDIYNSNIGLRTKVWQFASVIRNSEIGHDCNIASNAIVDGASVGNNCIVGHGSFVCPGILIGDDVFIGPHVSFCNDVWPMVEKTGWFNTEELISGSLVVSIVEDGASIGAGAIIMPGVTIGYHSMVAAGSVVHIDVPPCTLYTQDAALVPINQARPKKRMRVAKC